MLGHRELTFEDYIGILRRRVWLVVIPAILGPVLGWGGSYLLPERYVSQTLVLVEQQRVPESFVKSVVTDELNQRLGTMREQILSRARLQPIIEKFDLYKADRGNTPMEILVERLRKSIEVTPVKPVVAGKAGELPGFFVSVTASNALTAQQVCAEVTSLFLEENLRIREQRAEDTTQFLQKQLDDAKKNLDEQDHKLAEFKQRHPFQLPGNEQANMGILTGLITQLDSVNQSLARALSDKTFVESMLAQRLSVLDASQTGDSPEPLEQQLAKLKNDLITLEARYTSDHPDVIKLKGDIATLERKVQEARSQSHATPPPKERPVRTEPVEVTQLRNQLHATNETIKEKSMAQERLQEQIRTYQARVQLSPVVEQQYKELTRDYDTALAFYNDLLGKKSQSQMATNLERRQQGEQFRVMDPANLPERPTFPKRPLFGGAGLGLGLALGLGLTMLLEMMDKSMRSERDVAALLELPTLGLIPDVVPQEVRVRAKA